MKIPKEARKLSRSVFRSAQVNGRLDQGRLASLVQAIVEAKPRFYVDALKNLQRLVRMELAQRHARIESATPLDSHTSSAIVADLKARYGADITTELVVNPDLIGGLRVHLGSDVWDSSIRGRLNQLEKDLSKS